MKVIVNAMMIQLIPYANFRIVSAIAAGDCMLRHMARYFVLDNSII